MKALQRVLFSSGWKAGLFVFVLALAAAIPMYFGPLAQAQMGPANVTTFYAAPLTGAPIDGLQPRGVGRYFVDSNNNRVFETEVGAVNLPAGSMLGVFIDGQQVGAIRVSSMRSGFFRLSTMQGQSVPTIAPGAVLGVRFNGRVILGGVFGIPPAPSPSPSMSPHPTPSAVFYAPLTGATIDGVAPRGIAQYAEFGTASRRLGVFVDRVSLPQGTELGVFVDGNAVGNITLGQYGRGQLRLDSANGQAVPVIMAGMGVEVRNGAAVILSGTFTTPPPPPAPQPNRFFFGHMGGRQVVPPVETSARGLVRVLLNEAGTQATIDLGFVGLNGTQTTATINGPAQPGANGPVIFDLGAIGGSAGRIPAQTFDVTAEQVQQLRTGLWYAVVGTEEGPQIRGQIHSRTRHAGYGGMPTDDLAVFRPSSGTWYVRSGGGYAARTFGLAGDIPVSADYDGDGTTDHAVFRGGVWYVARSSDGGATAKQFGLAGDIPVRGDYDGDGIADMTVFRPSTGTWYVWKSNGTGYYITQFGLSGDRPVSTDIDGDGRTDIAVFRPSTGIWYWLRSGDGSFGAVQFGLNGDVPLGADFDGDGAGDVSVFRPSTGVWYIWRSSDEEYDIRQFGLSSDVAVPGNYDGDGIADVAVFRPSNGVWYIWRSSDRQYDFIQFGLQGDIPATAR